ncbi:hypothetical protein ACIA6T_01660 [Streptomyces sp. NPDC051740]|uniref:hypothetical protein n=1 Tax=Streptomyces sp. NPDC051740 TaxID=3365673 RepID=UPI0037A2D981
MTWSAAVPGAALRAMRAAAGWRAVRLALLVGVVFVLGVLCGERARAADGGPVEGTSSAIGSVAAGSVVPTGSGTAPDPDSNGPASVIEALTVPRPDVAGPIRPLTGTVVRSVDERVVRPAGELVGTVTDRLDEATPGQLPVLPALPALPALPVLPALPGLEQPAPLPELPELPELPGLPDVPEQTLPEPSAPDPQPSTPDPRPDTSAPPSDAPGQDAPAEPKGSDGPSGTVGPAAGPVAHGPALVRAGDATHADQGHRPAQDAVHADSAPAPHAPGTPGTPAGRSDGTTGSRSAADHGTPRHADAYAVTAHHRPPLRLVPGATVRAEAAGTRDPYRGVPVSPA